jgi:hypothetical protein
MAIDRNPILTIPVKTYTHYTECEPWCLTNIGVWNEVWWKDFPDIAMAVIVEGPHEDCYWFANERDALMFRLRFV